jgi:undecaprenyl-diphosphatase
MDQILPALILGTIQGLTEFLPISSSGHLIFFPEIFGWKGVVDSLEFDVALHLGSTVALVGFFWKDWVGILSKFFKLAFTEPKNILDDSSSKLLVLIVVGSIPAAIVGLFFKDFIETGVRSSFLVGVTLIVFGLLLWLADKAEKGRSFDSVGWKDAILVGIAQAVSLIPGVSRSGITITAARSQKISREAAVRFSFLLATPAVIGAGLLTFKDLWQVGFVDNTNVFLIGAVSAAISGWLTIKFLLNFVKNRGFTIFVIYRVLLGVLLIIWSLVI